MAVYVPFRLLEGVRYVVSILTKKNVDSHHFFILSDYSFSEVHNAWLHTTNSKTMPIWDLALQQLADPQPDPEDDESLSAEPCATGPHPQRLVTQSGYVLKANRPSEATCKTAINSFLSDLKYCPPCGPTCGEGGCVDVLDDTEVRSAVSHFLFQHFKKEKQQRDQTLVDWVRAAWVNGSGASNDKYHFPIPCSDVSFNTAMKLRRHSFCKPAIQKTFNLGRKYWASIVKKSQSSGIVPAHGNTGKVNGRRHKEDGEVMIAVRAFFANLEKEAAPCATRIVREEETGQTTLRDDDDKAIFLPMIYGRPRIHFTDYGPS